MAKSIALYLINVVRWYAQLLMHRPLFGVVLITIAFIFGYVLTPIAVLNIIAHCQGY